VVHNGIIENYMQLRSTVETPFQSQTDTEFIVHIFEQQLAETGDTLEVIKMAKAHGMATLAFCNVDNSSIVRVADKTILLRAGIEKGVASTKAFSAQVMSLWLLAVYWGQARNLLQDEKLATEIAAMRQCHEVLKVQQVVHERIHRLSKRYLHGHGFFFIGQKLSIRQGQKQRRGAFRA
jgi:glucosamine--fructose-6-phosphate aminotransferase (isomerizing)